MVDILGIEPPANRRSEIALTAPVGLQRDSTSTRTSTFNFHPKSCRSSTPAPDPSRPMANEACIDTGRLTGGDWAEIQGMGGVRWLSPEAEHGLIHTHLAVGEVVRESPTDRTQTATSPSGSRHTVGRFLSAASVCSTTARPLSRRKVCDMLGIRRGIRSQAYGEPRLRTPGELGPREVEYSGLWFDASPSLRGVWRGSRPLGSCAPSVWPSLEPAQGNQQVG